MYRLFRHFATAAFVFTALMAAAIEPVHGASMSWDADEAYGSVSKSKVQTAFRWSDKQFQSNVGTLKFRVSAWIENTWGCGLPDLLTGEYVIDTQRNSMVGGGSVRSEARSSNGRVSGFSITGYAASPTWAIVDGPDTGSCPAGWEYDHDLLQVQIAFLYEASTDGTTWVAIR